MTFNSDMFGGGGKMDKNREEGMLVSMPKKA